MNWENRDHLRTQSRRYAALNLVKVFLSVLHAHFLHRNLPNEEKEEIFHLREPSGDGPHSGAFIWETHL
jgi:hypothetical protein